MAIVTPVQLRENSRAALEIARHEEDRHFKGLWADYALALAQLAEQIERREKAAAAKELAA